MCEKNVGKVKEYYDVITEIYHILYYMIYDIGK